MKLFAIAVLSLFVSQARALGPEEFKTIAQIQAGAVVNVTCSDITSPTQSHIELSFINGKFEGYLTLTAVAPAKGVSQDKFTPQDTERLEVKFEQGKLFIEGSLDGGYFSPDFFLVMFDTKQGLRGVYSFNDNDGVMVNNRNVVCGATNYGITLN